MQRQELSRIAHADHPIAAPVGDDAVAGLLDRSLPVTGGRVLDLGCGSGEWLLRALEARPRLHATGVDVSATALAECRERAGARGVAGRLELHEQDAAAFRDGDGFDAVLCVGSTHAFGGLLPALAGARAHLAPGGCVLVGDGYWAAQPSTEATGIFGELPDLAALVEAVVADGWAPVHGHLSTPRELDAYEWAWTGSLTRWALDHRDHPDSEQALATAAQHRDEWLATYRGVLGFACLVLRDVRSPA